MAISPARACMHPGCPNLVTVANAYRCPEHEREYLKNWERPRDVKYTSGMWKKLSRLFLANHPLCERCGAPSELAHHVYRKREGGSDDFENLEALCRKCHEAEHNEKGERWKKRERTLA